MNISYIDPGRDDLRGGPRLGLATLALNTVRKATLYAIDKATGVYYELDLKADLDQIWLVLHCMFNMLGRYRTSTNLDHIGDEAAKQRYTRQLDEAEALIAHARNRIREIGRLDIRGGYSPDFDYPPSARGLRGLDDFRSNAANRATKAMTVRELIAALGEFDPDEEVFTINTCDCCTHFCELDAEGIGRRDVGDLDFGVAAEPPAIDTYPRDYDPDVHRRHPSLYPMPKPRSEWERPGVVIAGGHWNHYPDVPEKSDEAPPA